MKGINVEIGYVAVETFLTTEKYREWSKLHHVKEVVSLDCALCPNVLDNNNEDDLIYLQNDGFYYDIVNNLDKLISKVQNVKDKQILAVSRNPENDCSNLIIDGRFKFYGYDLLEDDTRISALVNCGGFDKAFNPQDISEYGLIKDFKKAKEVQFLLANEYPYENHVFCTLWAIWKMKDI